MDSQIPLPVAHKESSQLGRDDVDGSGSNSDIEAATRSRKKKSRWDSVGNGMSFVTGLPTILPTTLPAGMNQEHVEAYLVQLQIEEISQKLHTGDLNIPKDPKERSPSPDPVYSIDGKRLNTRESRVREKLEQKRHQLIQQMLSIKFLPLSGNKPLFRACDVVRIPQESFPGINFVGLLIGPRGSTLQEIEQDTGAKIILRGKGCVMESKGVRKDDQPLSGEDEPLHAFIMACNPEDLNKAVDRVKDVIRQAIMTPKGRNVLRRMQLRKLAELNGTVREMDGPRCTNCGSNEHETWLCHVIPITTNNIVCSLCGGADHITEHCHSKQPGQVEPSAATNTDQAKIQEEYMRMMAELGEVPVSQSPTPYGQFPIPGTSFLPPAMYWGYQPPSYGSFNMMPAETVPLPQYSQNYPLPSPDVSQPQVLVPSWGKNNGSEPNPLLPLETWKPAAQLLSFPPPSSYLE